MGRIPAKLENAALALLAAGASKRAVAELLALNFRTVESVAARNTGYLPPPPAAATIAQSLPRSSDDEECPRCGAAVKITSSPIIKRLKVRIRYRRCKNPKCRYRLRPVRVPLKYAPAVHRG